MTTAPKMGALIHNDGMEPTIKKGSIAVAVYPDLTAPERWQVVSYRSQATLDQVCLIAKRDSRHFGSLSDEELRAFYKSHFDVFGPLRINRIGRVVGLPGETIAIKSDGIYINEAKLSPPSDLAKLYEQIPEEGLKPLRGVGVQRLPENHVFILQDNLRRLNDSRSFGSVKLTSILGTLSTVINAREVFGTSMNSLVKPDARIPEDLLQDLEEQHGPRSTWMN